MKVKVNFSAITLSSGLLQFGGVVVDSTKTLLVTLTGAGTLTETINSLSGLGAAFIITFATTVSLPAGTSI